MNNRDTLKQKWSEFLKSFLEPWVVVLLILTILLLFFVLHLEYLLPSSAEDSYILNILIIITSIIAGVLGGAISNKWSQSNDMKLLASRGNSAIRSLNVISGNISSIHKRALYYPNKIEMSNSEYKLLLSSYEEIIDKCEVLQEQIIYSIENWTDIIPSVANLKSQIGLINEMKKREEELKNEINSLTNQISSIKTQGKQENEFLKLQLQNKEKELHKTQFQLEQKEGNIGLSGATNFINYVPPPRVSFLRAKNNDKDPNKSNIHLQTIH